MSSDLMQMLASGMPILMDGALGTELERRGVPIEERGWSAVAVSDHEEIVQAVHEDYLHAGSRLHIVNSFALARHVLDPIGMGDQFEFLNRQSVKLFDQAVCAAGVDRDLVWAAGSLSTFSADSDRSMLPSGVALTNNCRDQAEVLASAGVELFALEMLFDVEVTARMLEAVKPFGMPIIFGVTCEWGPGADNNTLMTRNLDGRYRPLKDILPDIISAAQNTDLILSIMHSDLDVTESGLEVLRQFWDGHIAIYPNSGEFHNLRMDFNTVCSPTEFTGAAKRWISSGVNILGGCCGIGPSHIAALQADLVM